jgi:lipopolysaccharide biosynthesis glycosyltransferase
MAMQYPAPQPCPLVFACDEAYAMPLATTLRSIADHNHTHAPLDVHVLTDHYSQPMRRKVVDSVPPGSMHIRWREVDLGLFHSFGLLDHVSRMTYARLQIPHLYAGEVPRLLYLDTDILVLADLSQLWRTDLEGAPLAAVRDYHVDRELKSTLVGRNVNVPRVPYYFNAGVLLMDPQACLQRGLPPRALAYLRDHADTPYGDQDALNAACDGQWKALDPKWNFQNHHALRIDRLPAAQRPAIVHFITGSKPWKPSSASVNAALYDRYRSRTRFQRSPSQQAAAALSTLGWRVKYRLQRMRAAMSAPATIAPHGAAD